MIANVDGGDPVDGGFDLLAIAIIDETRGRRRARNGSLNPAQTELVRALREGLGLLEKKKMDDVKAQNEVAV